MSELQLFSDFTSIPQPHCPNCQSEMVLSRILPSRAALDLRSFEYGKCAHVEKVAVEQHRPLFKSRIGSFRSDIA